MDWSTVVAIALTAVFSLGATYIASTVQHRRDRDAQELHNRRENDRQANDLASRERQAAEERKLQDTLDWRERRLSAYSAVVAVSDRCIDMVYLTSRGKNVLDGPTWEEGARLEMDLRRALAEVELISDSDVRTVGATLVDRFRQAHHCARNVRLARDHQRSIEMFPDNDADVKRVLEQIADHAPVTTEAAAATYQECRETFRAAARALHECHDAWLETSRNRLGLTD